MIRLGRDTINSKDVLTSEKKEAITCRLQREQTFRLAIFSPPKNQQEVVLSDIREIQKHHMEIRAVSQFHLCQERELVHSLQHGGKR